MSCGSAGAIAADATAEGAIAELESAIKGDDKAQIEAKAKALEEAGQAVFAAVSAAGQQAEGGDAGAQPAGEDVVDAEFTEVKDDGNKA